jgi:phage tail-like protein
VTDQAERPPQPSGRTPSTALVRGARQTGAPAAASARRHLRDGLPEIYRLDTFTMNFLSGFEEVLDPIIATRDTLPAYFGAALAPPHALEMMAGWLGVDEVETLPPAQRRKVLLHAGELAQWRGTLRGLTLVLELFFPDIRFAVEESGGVRVHDTPIALPRTDAPWLKVTVLQPLEDPADQQAIDQCITRWKPAHVRHQLILDLATEARVGRVRNKAAAARQDDEDVEPDTDSDGGGPQPDVTT